MRSLCAAVGAGHRLDVTACARLSSLCDEGVVFCLRRLHRRASPPHAVERGDLLTPAGAARHRSALSQACTHTHRESAPAKVLAEGASQVAPHVVDSHLRDKVHPERALVSARLQLHIHHLLTDFYHLGSNACVFTGARECRKGVHTAFIDINAPRCAALLARAGGDLGRLSGDFQDCHRGVRG